MMQIMKNEKRKLKFGECLLLWKRKKRSLHFFFKLKQDKPVKVILELDPDTLPVDGGVEHLIKVL